MNNATEDSGEIIILIKQKALTKVLEGCKFNKDTSYWFSDYNPFYTEAVGYVQALVILGYINSEEASAIILEIKNKAEELIPEWGIVEAFNQVFNVYPTCGKTMN